MVSITIIVSIFAPLAVTYHCNARLLERSVISRDKTNAEVATLLDGADVARSTKLVRRHLHDARSGLLAGQRSGFHGGFARRDFATFAESTAQVRELRRTSATKSHKGDEPSPLAALSSQRALIRRTSRDDSATQQTVPRREMQKLEKRVRAMTHEQASRIADDLTQGMLRHSSIRSRRSGKTARPGVRTAYPIRVDKDSEFLQKWPEYRDRGGRLHRASSESSVPSSDPHDLVATERAYGSSTPQDRHRPLHKDFKITSNTRLSAQHRSAVEESVKYYVQHFHPEAKGFRITKGFGRSLDEPVLHAIGRMRVLRNKNEKGVM
ncbi:hypothetical protein CBOM_01274 [Ceraceosorus bombacis]|uniref:Uncharacterized protein n=1 Tax=Ceraceosorus bombacis TaxID=401625 RepID=A0A0P1BCZ8_9BASI|nr:hypothetical protein CBOM_01274 [Ceraceosorus bombacis]